MEPTQYLRFIIRDVPCEWDVNGVVIAVKKEKILQQKWESNYYTGLCEQWRDVPIVEEGNENS